MSSEELVWVRQHEVIASLPCSLHQWMWGGKMGTGDGPGMGEFPIPYQPSQHGWC